MRKACSHVWFSCVFALVAAALAHCGSSPPEVHDGGTSGDAATTDGSTLATPCVAPAVDCGGACVDLPTDVAHCGSCGRACAKAEVCTAGTCAVPCTAAGHMLCGAACIDTRSDDAHCGGCSNTCPAGKVCSTGACVDDPCAAYADCVHCTPDRRCGWCATKNACGSTSTSSSCGFWFYGTC